MKRVPSFFVIVVMVVTLGIALGGKAEERDIEKAETKFIPGDDIHIAYKVGGQGSPLVLIMGYSGTMDLWSPELLNELSFYHRVIIFDNRGMGKTTASEKNFPWNCLQRTPPIS